MRTPVKLAAYSGILAVVFAGALGAGNVIGSPAPDGEETHHPNEVHGLSSSPPASGHRDTRGSGSARSAPADSLPGGPMVSAGVPGDGETESGPEITFSAAAPPAGNYRLFLNFRHNSVVRPADGIVSAGRADA